MSPLAALTLALVPSLAAPAPRQVGPGPAHQAPRPAAAELAQGEQLLAAARYPEAAQVLSAAVRREPQNPGAWNLLGLAWHFQKDWGRAITAFDRARALLPKDPRVLDNLAVCHFELQALEQAAELFRAALAVDPADSRAHLFLARIAAAQGDAALAEREFALALAAPAPDPVAALHQGLFFRAERRLDEARAAFERALELDPDLAGAHLNLGLVLQQTGRREEAEAHLKRFRELSEVQVGEQRMRLRVTAYVRDANTDLEAGRVEAALASALRARDEAPDLPFVHELLARILARLGRVAESERERALARELAERAQGR